MPEAVIMLTTNQTRPQTLRKPVPLSEIEVAHARMAVAVSSLKPIPLGRQIEALDVLIRARHLRAVLEEIRTYASAAVAEIAAHVPVEDETGVISDAAGEIAGALLAVRNRLEEAEGA
jgi:hypothetical protein